MLDQLSYFRYKESYNVAASPNSAFTVRFGHLDAFGIWQMCKKLDTILIDKVDRIE